MQRHPDLSGSSTYMWLQVYLTLSSHEPDSPRHNAYVRSRTTASFDFLSVWCVRAHGCVQTSFTLNGTKIFNEHPREWIVPEILRAIADVSPSVWDPFTHGWGNL